MKYNENSRVKIPALIHLERLGYKFIDQKNHNIDRENNIFLDILQDSLLKLNPGINKSKIDEKIDKICQSLLNEDLGKQFLDLITKKSEVNVIDFENISNNKFNVVTELKYSKVDGEEFFPDITILVNGLPLSFIEVKKPNNKDGMLAEKNRMNSRFLSKHNKTFWNITQLMIFSNNMEYSDSEQNQKISGSYYSTPNFKKTVFNYFREEQEEIWQNVGDISENVIDQILQSTNLQSIKASKEFEANLNPLTPLNKFLTSLLNIERFLFFIKYGIALLEYQEGQKKFFQKHIIRYPQFFAIQALNNAINHNSKKGIIWHTQGSGKTALAYHSVSYFTDYFSKKNIVSKFYFIVDRLDLLEQATEEFINRGLSVNLINSKREFVDEFTSKKAKSSIGENKEITVVNVQKFSDDSDVTNLLEYDVNFQRVYFIDEAHRSYKKEGNFFTNLVTADRNAIMISLTGTPRLKDFLSKDIFGNYLHTYYYNKSIKDGFTLRLMREEIESSFKASLDNQISSLEVKVGSVDKSKIMAHENIVRPLSDYIVKDLENSRVLHDDFSIGGMVVAYDSPQAREIYNQLKNFDQITAALILYDEGDKTTRKNLVKDYKKGNIDFLVVDKMLLTGFDAPRLKKLYLCRTIKNLSLLQTLTRVNRPYRNFQFGYIVDFADISSEFDKTNRDYLEELKSISPETFDLIDTIFISETEIKEKIILATDQLFLYNTENLEEFSLQINNTESKEELLNLKQNLETIKNLYNVSKQASYSNILNDIDIERVRKLLTMVTLRIGTLNLQDSLEDNESTQTLINYFLNTTNFSFLKKGEEELKIVDEVISSQKNIANEISKNIDNKDIKFITLLEEFKRIAKNSNISDASENLLVDSNQKYIEVYKQFKNLNAKDALIREKYQGDAKFVRIHKRTSELLLKKVDTKNLIEILNFIKNNIDKVLSKNMKIINNYNFFLQTVKTHTAKSLYKFTSDQEIIDHVTNLITEEYENEFTERAA